MSNLDISGLESTLSNYIENSVDMVKFIEKYMNKGEIFLNDQKLYRGLMTEVINIAYNHSLKNKENKVEFHNDISVRLLNMNKDALQAYIDNLINVEVYSKIESCLSNILKTHPKFDVKNDFVDKFFVYVYYAFNPNKLDEVLALERVKNRELPLEQLLNSKIANKDVLTEASSLIEYYINQKTIPNPVTGVQIIKNAEIAAYRHMFFEAFKLVINFTDKKKKDLEISQPIIGELTLKGNPTLYEFLYLSLDSNIKTEINELCSSYNNLSSFGMVVEIFNKLYYSMNKKLFDSAIAKVESASNSLPLYR
ncbi:Uncharacterised protein [Candidatus Tiddalikarchaeum anstoanum]|nr:Uncharacterised protein [Candidatus Tiddalikarchaeum anstoanum]